MADNVKQHIVPRFYIAYFHAEDDERVFVRIKGIKGIDPKSPSRQGYEEDAYTVMNAGVRDTSCDEANKRIEGWCSTRLATLTATASPTNEQWQAIFFLTANLICRSRWTRDDNRWKVERVQKVLPKAIEFLKTLPPLPESVRHLGCSPNELDDLPGVLSRVAEVQYPLTAALGTEPVAEELKTGKDCDLLIAPESTTFITSDEPAIILEGGKPVMMKVAPGFLARREVEVYLPLNPNLACLWSPQARKVRRRVTAHDVAAYNRMIWENCYERSFASRRDDLEQL